jgi:hypothetical protein
LGVVVEQQTERFLRLSTVIMVEAVLNLPYLAVIIEDVVELSVVDHY